MRSLTWDRGGELAAHRALTIATDVQVYFCDPQSPWQRGSNENTNGLLRQYLPHAADFSSYSQAQLDAIALMMAQVVRYSPMSITAGLFGKLRCCVDPLWTNQQLVH